MIALTLIVLWLLLCSFPTMYIYYYPDEVNTDNQSHSNQKKKQSYFESWLRLFLFLVITLLYIYASVKKILLITSVFNIIVYTFYLFTIIQILIIVFDSIFRRKKYSSFSTEHNSMKHLSNFFCLLIIIAKPEYLPQLIEKTTNSNQIVSDIKYSLVYLSLNIVFCFFILAVSIFLIQDILIYLSKKNWYKKRSEEKRTLFLDCIKKIELHKNNIWLLYSQASLKKIIYVFVYFFILLTEILIKGMNIFILYLSYFCNVLAKTIKFICTKIYNYEAGYILAITSRISIVLAISITFILFKYNQLISENGVDILEFICTIFFLPIVFRGISKYSINQKGD